MFLEPGTRARPHSLDIFVAFASQDDTARFTTRRPSSCLRL